MQENTLWQHDICQKSEFHKYTVHTVHSWFPSRHKRTYSVAAMGAIHFPQLPLHNFIQGEGIEYFIWCIPVFYPLFSVNYRHLYSIYFQINKYCFYLVVCFFNQNETTRSCSFCILHLSKSFYSTTSKSYWALY